ncbi:MAG: hypothetical protein WAV05_18225, partial [Anaerolineales bacterium]
MRLPRPDKSGLAMTPQVIIQCYKRVMKFTRVSQPPQWEEAYVRIGRPKLQTKSTDVYDCMAKRGGTVLKNFK